MTNMKFFASAYCKRYRTSYKKKLKKVQFIKNLYFLLALTLDEC